MKPTFRVAIKEYERGWGSKVESIRAFDDYEEAERFIKEFNATNTSKEAPDWYMQAEALYSL